VFLDDAMAAAREAARRRMDSVPVSKLEEMSSSSKQPPDFEAAVSRGAGPVRAIAEVKRMSPSAGTIREGAPVGEIASAYERAGASAVSVITCGFRFGGAVEDLEAARTATALPLLRKDFISVPYQVFEARAFGASAVLLISEALEARTLLELAARPRGLDMSTRVEAHTREGLEKALESGAGIVGINNRDLRTLDVDVSITEMLLPFVPPDTIVVSESGIRTRECVARLAERGVDALLIGEELMRAAKPGDRLRELLEEVDESCG
jgi:indole-3-glycerol phosphate synthase